MNNNLETLLDAVRKAPERADLHYLLGAECAAAGRYDLAVDEMARATELDPKLHTARLQLGLLHLTCARPAEALAAWSALEALPETDALRLFAAGLKALARDDFTECIGMLEAGIRANSQNAPLNRDMALILERARTLARRPGGTQ